MTTLDICHLLPQGGVMYVLELLVPGVSGGNQYFTGASGQTAPFCGGIANWDWWGTFYQVLLTPKRWLVVGSPHSWYGCNYKANFQVVL